MVIYLIIFFISAISSWIGERFLKSKKKKNFFLFSFIAILLPSALAGYRALGVGTDTKVYIEPLFKLAFNYNSFIEFYNSIYFEPLYMAITYLVSKFTTDVNVLYFILQFIIMIFSYLACFNLKKENYTMPYLMFLLLYYNKSLNMCRQTIAIVIILFATKYMIENKPIKYFLWIVIAYGFHKTALIGLPLYFVYYMINIRKNERIINKVFILSAVVFVLLIYRNLMMFLVSNNFLDARYLYYVKESNSNVIIEEIILRIIILFISLIFYKRITKINELNETIIYFLILDIFIYFVGFYANYAQRIAYYFGYYNIFIIPELYKMFKSRKDKTVIYFLILITISAYSFYYYGIRKYDETVPYVSIMKLK